MYTIQIINVIEIKANWNFRVRHEASVSPNLDSVGYLTLMQVVISLDDLKVQNLKD